VGLGLGRGLGVGLGAGLVCGRGVGLVAAVRGVDATGPGALVRTAVGAVEEPPELAGAGDVEVTAAGAELPTARGDGLAGGAAPGVLEPPQAVSSRTEAAPMSRSECT
jgi:hypothetical protein